MSKAAMRARELWELDVAVARAISKYREPLKGLHWMSEPPIEPYSRSANAALAAYEVMRKRGWHMTALIAAGVPNTGCHATLFRGSSDKGSGIVHGDTFAEAISRAIVAAAKLETPNV